MVLCNLHNCCTLQFPKLEFTSDPSWMFCKSGCNVNIPLSITKEMNLIEPLWCVCSIWNIWIWNRVMFEECFRVALFSLLCDNLQFFCDCTGHYLFLFLFFLKVLGCIWERICSRHQPQNVAQKGRNWRD